ncbi:MAG: FliM/FliN family flagellar motor C-terminal domain-containing protein [Acidobacteriota bacterium]
MNDVTEVPRINDGGGPLDDMTLPFTVPVGHADVTLADLLALAPGSAVPLDVAVDAPVPVVVNGLEVATGRLVLAEGQFAVRIETVQDGIGQSVLASSPAPEAAASPVTPQAGGEQTPPPAPGGQPGVSS